MPPLSRESAEYLVEGEGGVDLTTGQSYTQGPVNENPYASMGSASFNIGMSAGFEVFGH